MKTLRQIQYAGQDLTSGQREEIMSLLSGRVRAETRARLQRRIELPLSLWPMYGIFDRIHFEGDFARYCAGQDYGAEIRYIRELILRG